jgi:hypothetical protein
MTEQDLIGILGGGGRDLTAEALATNAIDFAHAQLGGRFRLGGAGYPRDRSKPINLWVEKGFNGYQIYVHDRAHGATSVITDTRGNPVRIKPL